MHLFSDVVLAHAMTVIRLFLTGSLLL